MFGDPKNLFKHTLIKNASGQCSFFSDLRKKREKKNEGVNYLVKIDGLLADQGPELTVNRPPTRQKAMPSAFKRSQRWRGRDAL